jgi:hypothetical protein
MIARLHLAAYVLLHGLPPAHRALIAAMEDADYWRERCAYLLARPPLDAATRTRIKAQVMDALTLQRLADELRDVGTDPSQEARP